MGSCIFNLIIPYLIYVLNSLPFSGTGKKSAPSSPQMKIILWRSPKASTPAKQNVEKSQTKTKSGLKYSSPRKAASLYSPGKPERSKYFEESSEDSGETSNAGAVRGRKKQRKLQFVTNTSKQTGAESPLKLSTTTDDESSELVKKKVGRPRKKPLTETEASQSSETRKGSTPSKLQKSSPSVQRTSSKNRETDGDSPRKVSRNQGESDTAKTGHSDKLSNVQTLEKKFQKTLYNTEGSTLTPGQVKNIPKSPTKSKEGKASIGCLFKATSKKASSSRAVNTRSSRVENANVLDDSIDDDELEDDFDKELLKRVARTSTQISDDEGQFLQNLWKKN